MPAARWSITESPSGSGEIRINADMNPSDSQVRIVED